MTSCQTCSAQESWGETHQAQLDEQQFPQGNQEEEEDPEDRRPDQVGLGGDEHPGSQLLEGEQHQRRENLRQVRGYVRW